VTDKSVVLRSFPVIGFPCLMFHFERQPPTDIGRVPHGKRDIPARMGQLS